MIKIHNKKKQPWKKNSRLRWLRLIKFLKNQGLTGASGFAQAKTVKSLLSILYESITTHPKPSYFPESADGTSMVSFMSSGFMLAKSNTPFVCYYVITM